MENVVKLDLRDRVVRLDQLDHLDVMVNVVHLERMDKPDLKAHRYLSYKHYHSIDVRLSPDQTKDINAYFLMK